MLDANTRIVGRPAGRPDLFAKQPERADVSTTRALEYVVGSPFEKKATYVLAGLLGRVNLSANQAEASIRRALEWLASFPFEKKGQFVLCALLKYPHLSNEQAGLVIDHAARWVEMFHQNREIVFVLSRLLGRKDLTGRQRRTAVTHALKWLALYSREPEAGFVLPILLERRDIGERNTKLVIATALDWLPYFIDAPNAEFVLKRLLCQGNLDLVKIGDLKRRAVDFLTSRLATRGDKRFTFVMRPWLRCRIAHPELDRQIVNLAVVWLRTNLEQDGADFIFNQVLRNSETTDVEWRSAALAAEAWLGLAIRARVEEDFAVNSVLIRPELVDGELRNAILRRGFRLLRSEKNQKARLCLAAKLLRAAAYSPEPQAPVS